MKFVRKHPLLFCELLGFALLIIDFIYMLNVIFGADSDNINYPFFVFTALGGIFLMALSPLVVLICHNNKDYAVHFDRIIMQLNSVRNGYKSEAIIAFAMVAIVIFSFFAMYIVGENVNIILGIAIFILSFYLTAFVFNLYKKWIVSKFYKVKNGEQKFELIKVEDLSFLDELYKDSALTFAEDPNPLFLNFIYNWLNNKDVLKDEIVKIYTLTGRDIKEKYNVELHNDKDFIMCIMLKDLNFNEVKLKAFSVEHFAVGGRWFDDIADNCIKCVPCTKCHLGSLSFYTEIATGTVYLICDGCGTLFDTPEDAFNGTVSVKKYSDSRKSTLDEIKNVGWEEFILDYR